MSASELGPATQDEINRVLMARVRDTEVTALELFGIGHAFLNYIGMVQVLGHTRPGNSLDYVPDEARDPFGLNASQMVQDFVVWTSGRKQHGPLAETRLRNFIEESGWLRSQMNSVGEALGMGRAVEADVDEDDAEAAA